MVDYTFPLASDIITKIQRLVGEIAGPQVQEFSEAQYYDHLQRTFNMVFTKYPWEMYRRWHSISLDETTGKPTTSPFGDIRDMTDFLAIYIDRTTRMVPMLPHNVNPYVITGTALRHWTSLPVTDVDFLTKRLQFWPVTASADLNILVRVHPGRIIESTRLYIDQDLLEYGCAWQILEDEGTNDAGANRAQFLFDDRWRSLMNEYARHPIEAGTRGMYPTNWMEAP